MVRNTLYDFDSNIMCCLSCDFLSDDSLIHLLFQCIVFKRLHEHYLDKYTNTVVLHADLYQIVKYLVALKEKDLC